MLVGDELPPMGWTSGSDAQRGCGALEDGTQWRVVAVQTRFVRASKTCSQQMFSNLPKGASESDELSRNALSQGLHTGLA